MWTRSEVAAPRERAKAPMAASISAAVDAADHSWGAVVLSRARPSHERSRVCHGQM
jgi:hypothetical protein